uniref:LNS2/PITP domain-containing protein n=1 Tax=Percolomonas cosmopolitus TaxID=63605 RepID=A0A7S1KU76_9EUKA|mmetsp:Transcript_9803/g.36569  ORF Transcript_9803/g.36569 Transcript_9803/m.36569 type:complete len:581 (+) Transcript_9803:145-1887(+)|eukprot:CAMPEP_0117445114 /NCGR_PEP_ID=MMETSP0759-20121206/5617_1 /TAXON_ID=63605 /ORGANISM="Percolomonas cosmopolitus, Strain WS" /LENGTH=580 /DNA_ID=CAMNT_0005237257 /DNA_START=117 /DNA_END=1859 /DNA_ORIENTATION=-
MSACDVIFVKRESVIVTSPILVRYKHKAKERHDDIYLHVKDEQKDEWLNTGIQLELLTQRHHLQMHGQHTEEKAKELGKQIEKAAVEKKTRFVDKWMQNISKNTSALESLMVHRNSQKLFEILENLGSDRFEISFRGENLPEISAHGYYWSAHEKVVISDVDGTISRSDLLGHLMPRLGLGLNWRHPGVVRNSRALAANGYKLIYLTARPISMASLTKKYICGLRQDNEEKSPMPFGPVLTTPYHMLNSFAVEVVIQQPHVFKIQLMRSVAKLFDKGHGICAAFGNKNTDESAYATFIDDSSKIFTINARGQLRTASNQTYKGYGGLADQVQNLFPNLHPKELADEEEKVPVKEEVALPDTDKAEKKDIQLKETQGETSLEKYAEDDACIVKKVIRKVKGNAELGAIASKQIGVATFSAISNASEKLLNKIMTSDDEEDEKRSSDAESAGSTGKKHFKFAKRRQQKRRSSLSSIKSDQQSVQSDTASEESLTPGSATSTSSFHDHVRKTAHATKNIGKKGISKTLSGISKGSKAVAQKCQIKAHTAQRVQRKLSGTEDGEAKVKETEEGIKVEEPVTGKA